MTIFFNPGARNWGAILHYFLLYFLQFLGKEKKSKGRSKKVKGFLGKSKKVKGKGFLQICLDYLPKNDLVVYL